MMAPDGDSPAGFHRSVQYQRNKLWVIPPSAATPTAPATKPLALAPPYSHALPFGQLKIIDEKPRSAPFLLLRKQPVDWPLETCGLARQSSLRASPDLHSSPKGYTATVVRRDFQTRPSEAYPSAGQDLNLRCRYTPDPPAGAGEKIAAILYCMDLMEAGWAALPTLSSAAILHKPLSSSILSAGSLSLLRSQHNTAQHSTTQHHTTEQKRTQSTAREAL
jgi:hypothetical protein